MDELQPKMAPGVEEESSLRNSGQFSEEEIAAWKQETINTLGAANFSEPEIAEYFGQKNPDMSGVKSYVQENIKKIPPPQEPQEEGFLDHVAKGLGLFAEGTKESATRAFSNLLAGRPPEVANLPPDSDTFHRFMFKAGALAADIPLMAAGGVVGAVTGTPVGAATGSVLMPGPGTVVGGTVGGISGSTTGAFAAPAALKRLVMDAYKKGDVKDFNDFWDRSFDVFLDTFKEGLVGNFTSLVGGQAALGLAKSGAAVKATGIAASEIATMVTVGHALNAQIPKREDFIDAALLVGGAHAIGVLPRLMDNFVQTGKLPHEQAQEALTNPAFRQELLKKEHIVTGEAIPSKSIEPAAATLPFEQKAEITKRTNDLFFDETGKNLLAEKLQIPEPVSDVKTGFYDKTLNPNLVAGFEGAPIEKVRAYAESIQYALKQDSVPFFSPVKGADPINPGNDNYGVVLRLGEKLSPTQEANFGKALTETLGDSAGFTKIGDNEYVIINYKTGEGSALYGDTASFKSRLSALKDAYGEEFKIDPTILEGVYQGEYRGYDWASDPTGKRFEFSEASRQSPDLRAWLDSRSQEHSKIINEYVSNVEPGRGTDRASGRPSENGSPVSEGKILGAKKAPDRIIDLPESSPGPNPKVYEVAQEYLRAAKLPERRQLEYVKADPERGSRIAQAYEQMKNEPDSPKVKAAYRALIDETVAQFKAIQKTGLKIEVIKPDMENPYPLGSKQMIEDINNGHLWFFPTDMGFGEGTGQGGNHPLLERTGIKIDGKELLANDVFRVVHDYFGHAKEGFTFGKNGEENAWQTHVRMYSELAAQAMTTETRGQNSWVNFGPKGEANQANPGATTYAEQKAGLLPEWVIKEGLANDRINFISNEKLLPMQQKAEARLGEILSRADAFERYSKLKDSFGGKVLNTDVARELSPEYAASKEGATTHVLSTHQPSSAFVSKYFQEALKKPASGPVLFLAGGGGSGKGAVFKKFADGYAQSDVVMDGTLSDPAKAISRIDAALESGRPVSIHFVYRPIESAIAGVIKRFSRTGRWVPAEALAEAHVGAIETVLEVAQKYAGNEAVTVTIFDNSGAAPKEITIEELAAKRYTKSGETITQAVDRLLPSVKEALKDVEKQVNEITQKAASEPGVTSESQGLPGKNQPGDNGSANGGKGGGGGSRILDRIGTPESKKQSLTFDEFYTKAIDDLHPIKQLTQALAPEGLPPSKDPYVLARLTRGAYGKADQFLELSPFEFESFKNVGKSFKAILEPVKDKLDGFREYALAKRAIELSQRGIETGIPIKDAKAAVRNGKKVFESVFQDIQEYQGHLLTYLRDSGVLSKDAFEAMKEANKDYVPFFRVLEQGENIGPAGRKLTVKNPVKTIKGSDRLITDPLESIIKNTYAFITLAERNRTLTKLIELGEGTDFIQKSKAKQKPIKVGADELKKFLEAQGIEADPESLTIFRLEKKALAKDEVAVFKDGKRQVYTVGENVAEAIKALDRESVSLLTKILSLPAKALRAGTGIAPDFILRNVFRDQITAYNQSKSGFIPGIDTLKGLGSLFKKDADYQAWLKSGGANSSLVAIDRQYIQENIFKLSQETGLMDRVHNLAKSPLEFLRISSELLENSTRLGEFKKSLKGKSDPDSIMSAGFQSREVTLDFARIGAKTRAMNMITAFWNAQIQGLDKVSRSFKEDPMGMTLKVSTSVTLPTLLLWWANHDDERYKELPRWQKDLFWIVPTDSWVDAEAGEASSYPPYLKREKGGKTQVNKGTIWRIPKPFDVGLIFGSIPERTLEAFVDQNPKAYKDLFDSFAQAFSPGYLPTFAQPIIEQFANKSVFSGKNIIPASAEDLLPEYQYSEYTSETAKLLGKFVASLPAKDARFNPLASPAVLENYITAWSGNMGKYALQLADKALQKSGVVPQKNGAEKTLAEMPIIKAFAIRYPTNSTQSIQDFFDRYKKAEMITKSIQALAKSGDIESAQKEMLLKENQQYLFQLSGIKEALGNQMRFIRLIDKNPDIRPEEKRQMIDGIYFGMQSQAKMGNEIFENAEKLLSIKTK